MQKRKWYRKRARYSYRFRSRVSPPIQPHGNIEYPICTGQYFDPCTAPYLTMAMMTRAGRRATTKDQSMKEGPNAISPQPTTMATPMICQTATAGGVFYPSLSAFRYYHKLYLRYWCTKAGSKMRARSLSPLTVRRYLTSAAACLTPSLCICPPQLWKMPMYKKTGQLRKYYLSVCTGNP